jgi:hypothetical protein
VSPDLSRDAWAAPASVGVYSAQPAAQFSRRGAVASLAPSYIDPNLLWAGTDDGLIHVTRDGGKTWRDVTPASWPAWGMVSAIEASHFDGNTAYAAVNTLPIGDRQARLYRTRDGGAGWAAITSGLPAGRVVHTVREDAQRRGLLFAGTEAGVFVSIDDGDSWQSLRLNMPATPVRAITIKDADLVAATDGRGFWILDDLMPLRQITPDVQKAPAFLFRPPAGWRTRWHPAATSPPVGPSGPALSNPPDGVAISYALSVPATQPVTLEVLESVTGEVIRRFSSDASLDGTPRLPAAPGLHRIVWDLRYAPPPVEPTGAIDREAALVLRRGLWVLPGTYQVRLTVDGRVLRQAVLVRLDPRVKTSMTDLIRQHALSKSVVALMRRLLDERAAAERELAAASVETRTGLTRRVAALGAAYDPLPALFDALQRGDTRPTPALEAAVERATQAAEAALSMGLPSR